MRAPEADLSKVRTVPIAGRRNRLDTSLLAGIPARDRSFSAFLESLPDVLAARDLKRIIDHLDQARQNDRGVVILIGGHVIKVGLGPLLGSMVDAGVISHVAMNGAAAIHDYELAAFGGTSEDVAAGLSDGSFGMAEETGSEMNAATLAAAEDGLGLGEGLAVALDRRDDKRGAETSLLLACRRNGIPVTVHPTIGADIIHQQPSFDGRATGQCSALDFRRLAGSVARIDDGGAVLNFGSAVTMPELFLKALTVARNLGEGRPRDFLAADFDMIRHYRPRVNVVERPTMAGGVGIQITGHHEVMIPMLIWGLSERLA